MLMFFKKGITTDLAEKVEVTNSEKSAINLWGENNYVEKTLPNDWPLWSLSSNLDQFGNLQKSVEKIKVQDKKDKQENNNKLRAGWWEIESGRLAENIRNKVPFTDWPILHQLMSNNIKPTDDDFKNHNSAYVIEELT